MNANMVELKEHEMASITGGPAPLIIIAKAVASGIKTLAASKAVQAGAGAGIAGAGIIAADNLTSK